MWARIVEVMLALFLILSTFIFPYEKPLWIFDLIVGTWIVFFALLSYNYSLRKIHLLNLLASFALVIFAGIQPSPPPAPYQSYMVLGILILMTAIIPSKASDPPIPWSEFYKKGKGH